MFESIRNQPRSQGLSCWLIRDFTDVIRCMYGVPINYLRKSESVSFSHKFCSYFNKTLVVCRFGQQRAMITCTFRARDLKTKNRLQQHLVTPFLKILNYDKIKFTFLDIVKSQPFDLMQILCQFLYDKAKAPLAA